MGDRIAIMRDGVLQQVGPPQAVYERPANLFVAGFIGTPPMNIIPARLAAGTAGGMLDGVVIGVRPEHLSFSTDGILPATVTLIESLGHERNIGCRLEDGTLVILRQDVGDPAPAVGESVRLSMAPEHQHVFDIETGDRMDRL